MYILGAILEFARHLFTMDLALCLPWPRDFPALLLGQLILIASIGNPSFLRLLLSVVASDRRVRVLLHPPLLERPYRHAGSHEFFSDLSMVGEDACSGGA